MEFASDIRSRLLAGMVIPAHPLALTAERRLDEKHQRALTRYYLASGAGGVAVGVHTTQFEIHTPEIGLYLPVLELAYEECSRFSSTTGGHPVRVAGIVGPSAQAIDEASIARQVGYDCGLLSLAALKDADDDQLIEHVSAVAQVIPVFGFYLQPAVGGRILTYSFWRRFVEIENVIAIKIAPFNRYQTIDVIRALMDSGRQNEIALYTGNDDNIIADLLTPFSFSKAESPNSVRIVGGLLGQWAVWTRRSVELLDEVRRSLENESEIPQRLLELNAQLTDANGAVFDVSNNFRGCIPGIHEVLRRQGLLRGTWCLRSDEVLSPGQAEELDRVTKAYPHLTDDEFVSSHLDAWLTP